MCDDQNKEMHYKLSGFIQVMQRAVIMLQSCLPAGHILIFMSIYHRF